MTSSPVQVSGLGLPACSQKHPAHGVFLLLGPDLTFSVFDKSQRWQYHNCMEKLLLNIDDLSMLLGISPATARNRLSDSPDTLPPRVILPAAPSKPLWRLTDIQAWVAGLPTARPMDRLGVITELPAKRSRRLPAP